MSMKSPAETSPRASSQQGALRSRYAAHFQPFYRGRGTGFATLLAALAVFGYGIYSLDMTAARLLAGLGELGAMTQRMLPPSPGSWA